MDTLFKILTPKEWETFQMEGNFKGSALDQEDGFIHTSLSGQYPDVLQKYFKGHRPLVLIKIDPTLLKAGTLRIEANQPGGEIYPHIYGVIPLTAIISHEVFVH